MPSSICTPPFILAISISTPPGGAQSDLAATDVATGQPNQSTDAYQGGGLMNSATSSTSYHYGGVAVAMGDAPSGYPNVKSY